MKIRPEDALEYHSSSPAGKLAVIPTKPCRTQRDLSLAYTPGVAVPCLEIERDPSLAYKYTAKGNLVAVVTNGTAVLGLGNIGALAGKPVMEGKGVLFKRFADIDVFDIELDTENADEIIRTCQMLEPTFGGINLEDIKAPECFYIEEELQQDHEDPGLPRRPARHRHHLRRGLLNALELSARRSTRSRWCSTAPAPRPSPAPRTTSAGRAAREHRDVRHQGRDLQRPHRGHEPVQGALRRRDRRAHAGRSAGGRRRLLRPLQRRLRHAGNGHGHGARSRSSSPWRIPIPKSLTTWRVAARPDAIVATGRSDYPNQVNNVLGFPFIFRGALDVRATTINDEMKLAATRALAALAKEDVPDSVLRAYGVDRLEFGRDYIIPKPFDPRVLIWEASAVAQAAMETGVAQHAGRHRRSTAKNWNAAWARPTK